MISRPHNEKDSDRPTSFETAARTRPLSIQDIMLRRKKKAKQELQDSDKGKSNRLEPGRNYLPRKDAVVEGSKKEEIRNMSREGPKNESMRYTSKEITKKEILKDQAKDSFKMDDLKGTPSVPMKDYQKDVPKKSFKKEKSSIRNDNHSISKDKGIHGLHKLSKSMRSWADERKHGNHNDIRARDGDATRSESLKELGKRWNDEDFDDDRIKDRSEKPQRETKRKGRGFEDERSPEADQLMLKKHDFMQSQVPKHSGRSNERKESTKMYHEEPRSKRRRSRSRDHYGDRHVRSGSLSPREQKHNYLGHGHDNNSRYYLMDKLRRKHAETDRHRTSTTDEHNGWSYQRYESRLGGYSPRKRKTVPKDEQPTIKTDAPVIRSPEKKSATWDQPPTGRDQSSFPATLQPTVSQLASLSSVGFAASKQNLATTLETILSGNSLSIDSVQLTQATRPLRRLHIENLPISATEDLLMGCLNDFLLSCGINHIQRSKQPCLSCTINKEKRQAFVEFLTPEDATAAISFDGRSFNGSALKIRRPKEFIEMTNVAPKKPAEDIKVISDVVADSVHKIFITGISGVISSLMLAEIVSAFGQLAAYRFICNEDLGGRCAFLEYVDHSITSKACAGLNGMKLGGCTLTAVKVFPNPPEEAGSEASPFYGIPDSAKSLLEKPTNVLQLKNVFDQEHLLLAKSELEEILEDVRLECVRFGAVKSIRVVEYPDSTKNSTEEIIVELTDGSVKIESTERGVNDNCTVAGTECSSPNKSTDVPGHSNQVKDAESISQCHDQKELDTLCECDVPDVSAASDHHIDLDLVDATAAAGPLSDEHAEANHTDSAQADRPSTAVGDDSAVGKGHADPITPEIGGTATPGDVERSERETDQQGANDMHESCEEKVPVADTRADALGTNVLEAGSILVEFIRKEAACVAAHCLHGRLFGNRTVSAGYVPHDLYLQRYSK